MLLSSTDFKLLLMNDVNLLKLINTNMDDKIHKLKIKMIMNGSNNV